MNIASPRRGSPPVSAAACERIIVRCWAYSMMMPTSATTNRSAASSPRTSLVDGERSMIRLRSLEPFIEQHERRDAMHQPAGNPHDQAGEPLIVDRVEADAGHPHRRII